VKWKRRNASIAPLMVRQAEKISKSIAASPEQVVKVSGGDVLRLAISCVVFIAGLGVRSHRE
jgi:hypothetical protein